MIVVSPRVIFSVRDGGGATGAGLTRGQLRKEIGRFRVTGDHTQAGALRPKTQLHSAVDYAVAGVLTIGLRVIDLNREDIVQIPDRRVKKFLSLLGEGRSGGLGLG